MSLNGVGLVNGVTPRHKSLKKDLLLLESPPESPEPDQSELERVIVIQPPAGNTCTPMGEHRARRRYLRSPPPSPPGSPRAVSPAPEPPFNTKCPVQSWHGGWDSTFMARRHNHSRVGPVKSRKEWFDADYRDKTQPCAPLTERKRTASHHDLKLGAALTTREWTSNSTQMPEITSTPPHSSTPRSPAYSRAVGAPMDPVASIRGRPRSGVRGHRLVTPKQPSTPKPPGGRRGAVSPGRTRLHSPDPIIVNDVHEPVGAYFDRQHQVWPEPVPTPLSEERSKVRKQKPVTGVPNSYYNPHFKSYWEGGSQGPSIRLQKRPAWYNNVYGSAKCMLINR